jgi:hypothetical protein
MTDISRRTMLGGVVAGAAASSTVLGATSVEAAKQLRTFKNEEFYTASGEFDVEAAKNAYYEMMEFYSYPIVPRLRGEEFWTLDFGLGKFTEVGMAGIFWMNELTGDYFGHEIYLLPGQMIPEHKHVKTAAAGPKMEGWHTRHGYVYTYGEGEPNPGDEERIPESHKECANARCAVKLMPGETNALGGPEQWHFMLAGPEGGIVSEYATYHDGEGLRFSHPDVVF